MATPERRRGIGGISVGGIIVVVGILTMIFWSIVLGLIITLVGLSRSVGLRAAGGTEPNPEGALGQGRRDKRSWRWRPLVGPCSDGSARSTPTP